MKIANIKISFLFIIIIVFSVVFFPKDIFAYDDVIVHPSLTAEMVKLYNFNYSDKLNNEEIGWMKKGSTDEDIRQGLLIRSGNHFYNPSGIKKWADDTLMGNMVPEPKLTAKEWAHNSLEQDSFPGGDYTWERAIWDYANGDKQHAYESLGHVMHLIEDLTVPAHVRNDLHISPSDKDLAPYQNLPYFEEIKKNLKEGEPYEAWTGGEAWGGRLKYDFAQGLYVSKRKPFVFSVIDKYFDDVAIYTNTNFFSKDTIHAYPEPKNQAIEGSERASDGKIVEYLYGLDENDKKIRLAKISYENSQHQKTYILTDKQPEIHSDYWSRLAPRAVLTGAGIIKLFKEEAKKAVQNPQVVKRPISINSKYGYLAPAIKKADPVIRQVVTAGQLLANAASYGLNNFLSSAKKSISQTISPESKPRPELDFSAPPPPGAVTIEDIIKKTQTAAVSTAEAKVIQEDPVYDAELVLDSDQSLAFAPGQDLSLSLRIKNTGTTVWEKDEISLNVYMPIEAAKEFYHSSWLTQIRPVGLEEDKVEPGSAGNFNFLIKSPASEGNYSFSLRPVWQSKEGEFKWLGADIAFWRIKTKNSAVESPEQRIADDAGPKKIAGPPAEKNDDKISNLAQKNKESGETKDKNEKSRRGPDSNNQNNSSAATSAASAARTSPTAVSDATSPETEIISHPLKITKENSANFKFSSSKENSEFYCGLDRADFAPCGAETVYENLGDGNHKLKVKAKDASGNFDSSPSEYSWLIDTVPPAKIAAFAASSGSKRGTIKLSWEKAGENLSYEIRYAEKEIVEQGADENQISWQEAKSISESVKAGDAEVSAGLNTPLSAGKKYYFVAKAMDEAGNISDISDSASGLAGAGADNMVISEILFAAEGSDKGKEFIELYNPTAQPADLAGWTLKYVQGDSIERNSLAVFGKDKEKEDKTRISENGFLLIGFNSYDAANYGNISADIARSASLPNGEKSGEPRQVTIILSDKDGNEIDKLDYNRDSIAVDGQSLERKANINSDEESMSGGKDKYSGNGRDTDNNADFVIREKPYPQNSSSFSEPRYAPEKLADFSAESAPDKSNAVKLIWSAPFGASGINADLNYDIRFSKEEITESNFKDASAAANIPEVEKAGKKQELEIAGLSLNQIYYFAIKTKDTVIGAESEQSVVSRNFPSAQALSPWPTYKGNNRRTGQSAYNGPRSAKLRWSEPYQPGGWVISSPSIDADENIYLWSCGERNEKGVCDHGSGYGYLASISSNKILNWKFEARYFENTPAFDPKGNVFFAYGGTVLKNDQEGKYTGAFGVSPDSHIFGSVLVSGNGAVYFAANGWIYATDSDLRLKWKYDTGGRVWGAPAEDKDGNIYVGAAVHKKETDPESQRQIFDKENSFYRLFSFTPNGELRWTPKGPADLDKVEIELSSPEFLTPAIGDTLGYISAKNAVYSFNLSDGRPELVYRISEEDGNRHYGGSPSLALDGTLYIAFTDGYLYALNPGAKTNERLKWKKQIATSLSRYRNYYYFNSPAIAADGTIYIGGENVFYALNPDGSEKWSYSAADDFPEELAFAGAPAIGKNGAIYVSFAGVWQNKGGKLYNFGD